MHSVGKVIVPNSWYMCNKFVQFFGISMGAIDLDLLLIWTKRQENCHRFQIVVVQLDDSMNFTLQLKSKYSWRVIVSKTASLI